MFDMYNKVAGKKDIRKIVAIAMMVSMSACSYAKPNARILNQAPENAPASYQKGWKDGCESGMAITGNQFYKAVYQNRIDVQRVNDTQYFRGWNEAKVYCAHYTMATQWEAGILPETPTEQRQLLPDTQGIFAVMASWGAPGLINFAGDTEEEGQLGFGGFVYQ